MKVQRLMAIAAVAMCCTDAEAALRNRYSFTGDAGDSVGGAHGTVVDPGDPTAVFSGGRIDLSANGGQGSNDADNDAFVNLPNGLISSAATTGAAGQVTVEIWAQSAENRNWAALFSAGTSNGGEDQANGGNEADYIQVIPRSGDAATGNKLRLTSHRANLGPEGQIDGPAELSTTATQHIVSVFDQSGGLPGTLTMYLDGALIGSAPIAGNDAAEGYLDLAAMDDNNVWIGRSQWPDPLFDGFVDELRIYDSALSAGQVATNFSLGADTLVPEPASAALLAGGAVLLALSRRKR